MPRIISFALGNIWRWTESKNRDVLIKYAKDLDVSGVEVTFSSKEELYALKLSKNNEDWLKSLDYVTIHAPFGLVRKADNEQEVIKQLNLIARLYDKINAKNVIIHPQDLPKHDILKNYHFKISTENLPKNKYISISELEKILNKYPKIGLCLDVSHAYKWSKYETGKLVKTFSKKITQIHFSGTYKKKDHQSLRSVTKDFLFSIQPIKQLNVPIVIEEDIKNKSVKFLKEEVEYIKVMFNLQQQK